MPEDEGTIAHILQLLSYLDRPRNALAVGVENLLDEDPTTGFFGGAYSGLMGERERSWADLAGIPRPESTDEWGPWLGKGAIHLAGDALLDPLLFLGPISKAGKAGKLGAPIARGLEYLAQPYRAASTYIHGTPFGRIFAPDVPAHLRGEIMPAYLKATREREENISALQELFKRARSVEEEQAGSLLGSREAFERPYLSHLLPEELRDVYTQLHDVAAQKRDIVNALGRSAGWERDIIGDLPENWAYNYIPLIQTAASRRTLARDLRRTGERPMPEAFGGRELQLMVDPAAYEAERLVPVIPDKLPIVTKIDHPLGGVTQKGEEYILKRGGREFPVQPVTATLKDIQEAKIARGREFVPSVSESYMVDILRKEQQAAFLKFIQKGFVAPGMDVGKSWIKRLTPDDDIIPKNWRLIRGVTGMDKFAAPKHMANFIEKKAAKMFDPDTPLGMFEQAGHAFANTRLGNMLREATNFWRRNVLAMHPGFYIGNAGSDIAMMHASGGVDAWLLPFRKAQAGFVQLGRGTRIFKNYDNAELGIEFANRGLWHRGIASTEVTDELERALHEGFLRRNIGKREGALGAVGKGITKAAEKWGEKNTWLLEKVGGNIEANSRIGVAIDWLKRNGINKPTPEDLDMAAYYATRALIDYQSLSPGERNIRMIIPFYSWVRGILGKTADDIVTSPDRLARAGRFLDMVLEPMPSGEQRISDAWIQENAPTFGAFGASWDDIFQRLGMEPEEAGPRMALAGRFLPWTQLEALMNRPPNTILSAINPLLKGPAELASNYSKFKERDIDTLTNFPGNVLNPIIGGPYQLATESPFGLRLPASWDYILTQMPGGRTMQAVSELGRGAGLWKDPYKADTSPSEALSWYMSGGKFYPFDRNKQLLRRQWELDRQAREITKNFQFSWARDDYEGMLHYTRLLEEHQARMERVLGFSEG